MMNKKGFTLMEVLTVMVIIAALVGVAYPQYRKVMQKSQVTQAVTILSSLKNSSERLATERGYRSYKDLFDGANSRAYISHMDLFSSDGSDGIAFKGCTGSQFTLDCSGENTKQFKYKVTGDYVAAQKKTSPNSGTILVMLRSDGKIYCKNPSGNTTACEVFGFPEYSGSVSVD